MIHRTLHSADKYAAEMSSVVHGTYTVIALDDGTYETVNGTGRGRLVSRFLSGHKTAMWPKERPYYGSLDGLI